VAEKSYDLDCEHFDPGASSSAEWTILAADANGETLVVEHLALFCASAVTWAIRKYVDGTNAFEWHVDGDTNEVTNVKGPWVLVGSSSEVQDIRVQRLSGSARDTVTAYFSRE
jgi:hypothetical protein